MNKYYVYMYTDQDNVPFYIGKGKRGRWNPKRHLHDTHLIVCRKIKKIGLENVRVMFLHKGLTEAKAFEWEAYWIKYIGRRSDNTGSLANLSNGGEGASGYKRKPMSDEIKRKISRSVMGFKHSDETKRRMSKAGMGRTPSDETRVKISRAHMGLTKACGERQGLSKLTEDQVKVLRRYSQTKYMTRAQMCKEFNISRSTLQDLLSRRTWKHVKG